MHNSSPKPLGLGLVGLGGAAVNMLPRINRSAFFEIVAAADTNDMTRKRFQVDFPHAQTYSDVEKLCADSSVTLVYIGTPNHLHRAHALTALSAKKHVLVEKPMAVTLDEAEEMIVTAEKNKVLLGVNVKHSFEPRIHKIRQIVLSGELGRLRAINSWRFVDWLYRPRSSDELAPGWGNGIVWRQGPHQFDIIRTIGGGLLRSVRSASGVWDDSRGIPGSFTTFFEFEDGVCGTAFCSGYDHFDSRDFVYGFDGASPFADASLYARARRELNDHANEPDWENNAASAERYGGGRRSTAASKVPSRRGGWILGGPLIVSFDKGDVRLSPAGLIVDGDERQWEIRLDGDDDGRDARLETFYRAIVEGCPLPADGRWGKATQEVLVAIEESAALRQEILLTNQVPSVDR